jgi:hypothetical protein
MVALYCNGRTHCKLYLFSFKVEILCAHTLAPFMMILLEALAQDYFWNLLSSINTIF